MCGAGRVLSFDPLSNSSTLLAMKTFYCGWLAAFVLLVGKPALGQPIRPTTGYAVLVGVPQTTATPYAGGTFGATSTSGAASDVALLAARMVARGFSEANIVRLTTPDQTRADSILGALRRVQRLAKPNDLVVFYFSGHGDQQPDSPIDRDEEDDWDEALIASDRAILDDELRPIWVGFGRQVRLLMLADACHSGSMFAFVDFAHQRVPGSFGGGALARRSVRRVNRGRAPASTRPADVGERRHGDTVTMTSAMRVRREAVASDAVAFRAEHRFALSTVQKGECLSSSTDTTEPYQMIYVGACYDKQTIPGGQTNSPFTLRLLWTFTPGAPGGGLFSGYEKWSELAQLCPAVLSYAELGVVSDSFRKSRPFSLN